MRAARSLPPTEIILIDNASTDQTAARARRLLENQSLPFQIIRTSRNHLGLARNEALRATASEWLAFTDSDCLVSDDWFALWARAIAAKPSSDIGGFGGGCILPADHPFASGWRILTNEKILHHGSIQARANAPDFFIENVNHVSTMNVLYHVPTIRKLGGFSSDRLFSGEDLDLSLRLRRQGYALYRISTSCVEHDIPRRLVPWLKKCFVYGRDQWPLLATNGFFSDPRRFIVCLTATAYFVAAVIAPWPLLLVPAFGFLSLLRHLRGPKDSRGDLVGILFAFSTQCVYAAGVVAGLPKALKQAPGLVVSSLLK